MDFEKIHWLTAIFLHLPVRVRALKAAPDTAGHPLGVKGGFAPCTPFENAGKVNNKQFDKPKFEIPNIHL